MGNTQNELTQAGVPAELVQRVFLLKSIDLFASMNAEELLPVADIVQEITFEQGDIIFEEEAEGQRLYLIIDGSVEVLHKGLKVADLGPRQCFGEMAILDHALRSATVRATAEAKVLAVAREDFQDLLDLYPPLARSVLKVLAQRLRETTAHSHD